MNKYVAAKVIWPALLRQTGSYLRTEKVMPIWRERNPTDGNQQSTNTACGGMIHNPRTAEQSDLNWSHFIQHFTRILLLSFFIFRFVSRSKVKKGQGESICGFLLNNISPGAVLQEWLQHYGSHPAGREVSRELDAGLNSATIDYHSIRLRLGFTACRRGAAGEEKEECIPNTHKPAPIAEMHPRQKW